MVLPPPLCLNCLTRAAVPTSPRLDGWLPARLRSTRTPRAFILTPPFKCFPPYLFLLPSSPCFCYFSLPSMSSRLSQAPPSLPHTQSLVSICILVGFLPSTALDFLPEQHVAGVEGKKKKKKGARVRWGEEKKNHGDKSSFPLSLLVAAKIHQLPP